MSALKLCSDIHRSHEFERCLWTRTDRAACTAALDMSQYVVHFTRGTNVREGADLTTELVMNLPKGTAVTVVSEAEIAKADGTLVVRAQLSEPCVGWVSLKTLRRPQVGMQKTLAKFDAQLERMKSSYEDVIKSPRPEPASKAVVEDVVDVPTLGALNKERQRNLGGHSFNSPRPGSARAPRESSRAPSNEGVNQIAKSLKDSSIAKLSR